MRSFIKRHTSIRDVFDVCLDEDKSSNAVTRDRAIDDSIALNNFTIYVDHDERAQHVVPIVHRLWTHL